MSHPVALTLPGEGTIVQVEVDGIAVAVAMVDGVLHAVDDECTHAACSLSSGEIEGDSVVCPCHSGTATVVDGRLELSR